MNRTEFIKTVGLSAGGIILPPTLLKGKPIKVYDNYVKGLAHYNFNKLKKVLKEGDELVLTRDLENVYDSFAVVVRYAENKLGYLPAYENIVLANMMDAGVELKAFVSQINLKRAIYEALSVEVFAELIIPTEKLIQTVLTEQRADEAKDIYRNY